MTQLTRGYSRDNDTVNPGDVFVKSKLEDNRGWKVVLHRYCTLLLLLDAVYHVLWCLSGNKLPLNDKLKLRTKTHYLGLHETVPVSRNFFFRIYVRIFSKKVRYDFCVSVKDDCTLFLKFSRNRNMLLNISACSLKGKFAFLTIQKM